MEPKRAILVGLVFAAALVTAGLSVPPATVPYILRPVGLFLLIASLIIYWPLLTPLLRLSVPRRLLRHPRPPIYGHHLMAAALVLTILGITLPIVRWYFRTGLCAPTTFCWPAVGALQIGSLAFALAILILAPLTKAMNGTVVKRARVYVAAALGLAIAVAGAIWQ